MKDISAVSEFFSTYWQFKVVTAKQMTAKILSATLQSFGYTMQEFWHDSPCCDQPCQSADEDCVMQLVYLIGKQARFQVPTHSQLFHWLLSLFCVADVTVPSIFLRPCTVGEAVRCYFDIGSVPRRSFFEMLAHFAEDELEREKLREFCTPEGQVRRFLFCTWTRLKPDLKNHTCCALTFLPMVLSPLL